jgi:aspartate ammonia-lyase
MEEVNMGGTAIGTGINADPDYSGKVIQSLCNKSPTIISRLASTW